MKKNNYKLSEIELGMTASYSQTITDGDVKMFSGISGDRNPIHLDEEFAMTSRYKKRIVHGMLPSSFFSSIFGNTLPGQGCVLFELSLNFKRPIYLGDTVKASVIVTEIELEKKKIFFQTTCKVKNKIVIVGRAGLFMPDKY